MAAATASASATTSVPDQAVASGTSRSTWIQTNFETFRDEIDSHNDRRERLIKTSRDITALSKKLIFLLHRFPIPDFSSSSQFKIPQRLLSDAHAKISEIACLILRAGIEENLSAAAAVDGQEDPKTNRYRYERNIGGGLEEFIEGVSFFHFLTTRRLISPDEVQAFLSVKDDKTGEKRKIMSLKDPSVALEVPDEFTFPIPTSRYLLGISDLTGELMRFATNSLSSTNNTNADPTAVVKLVLNLLRDLYEALTPLTPLVQDLGKKQRTTAQSLQKCEDLMYQLNIRMGEFAVKSGGGNGPDTDPSVVREMMRRALQGGSGGGRAEEGADE